MITKIVSGGQTGADRAALDFALEREIDCGGHVPKGRLAEDGPIPATYPNLVETETGEYAPRTILNVRDSDATLIVSFGDLTGGSLLTIRTAKLLGKPFLHVDLSGKATEAAAVRKWLEERSVRVLNVAGPRASSDARIYGAVRSLLRSVLGPG